MGEDDGGGGGGGGGGGANGGYDSSFPFLPLPWGMMEMEVS